jgi:hypothetical protein
MHEDIDVITNIDIRRLEWLGNLKRMDSNNMTIHCRPYYKIYKEIPMLR